MTTCNDFKICRRRIIPSETILLKDDTIILRDDDKIITKWNTLHPKISFDHGCSCYFLKEGYKISKFCRPDNSLYYWYCDIVDYSYDDPNHTLIVTDLLADVIVYPDEQVKIIDLDELALALESGLITEHQVILALRRLNCLLGIIYRGKFDAIQAVLERLDV